MILHGLVAGGTARQEQRLVLSPHDDIDAAQGSGEWISAVDPVEVRP